MAVLICWLSLIWERLLGTYIPKIHSALNILLEQDGLTCENTPASNLKVRVLLGIFLLMCIILSNGYKNVNVYKMVSPRNPERFTIFEELVDNNFSIYTWSQVRNVSWFNIIVGKWMSQNVSLKLSDHSISYHSHSSGEDLVTLETVIGSIMERAYFAGSNLYMQSKKEIQLNEMVHSKTLIHPVNLLETLFDLMRNKCKKEKRYISCNISLYTVAHEHKLENIESKIFLSVLNKCNRTALVLQSNQAESYARKLTPKRGNVGKNAYFQQYFVFYISGLVTPPFLSRLARIKESGIVEWWVNITSYMSTVQFHRSISGSKWIKEGGPAGASLDGNVVVIFSILLAGFALAMSIFTLEMVSFTSTQIPANFSIMLSHFVRLFY